MKTKSPALIFVLQAWAAIPGGSYQRLNTGMYRALSNAVDSGMKFEPADLAKMPSTGRWITGGGEGLYAAACGGERGTENISAAIAFEAYFGRKAWLWPEATKTPARLHVGSRFSWQGHWVTVTSFNDEKASLIACTYKNQQERGDTSKVGSMDYHWGGYRKVEAVNEYKDGSVALRYSAIVARSEDRVPERRFTITYDELMTVRKAADAKVRDRLKRIRTAATLEELAQVNAAIATEGRAAFRHFDIEQFQEAFPKREEELRKELSRREREAHDAQQAATHDADLARWKNGEDVKRAFMTVSLRVKDGWVETSTMQRATLGAAKAALKFARRYRQSGWHANGASFDVDQFKLEDITPTHVTVGCTAIRWEEIDRIAPLLK